MNAPKSLALNGDHVNPVSQRKTKINALFVITGLGVGGAETMLWRLLSRLDRTRYSPSVISLRAGGPFAERVEKLGVPVYSLDWQSALGSLRAFKNLVSMFKGLAPTFVQGWMLHANAAALMKYFVYGKQVHVIWNVRHSFQGSESLKISTQVLDRALGYLSWCPRRIVYNSQVSAIEHEQMGYDARRTVVIPNGFDCDMLRPRPELRLKVRRELGLDVSTPLIGLFARVHPMKDHTNFLHAAQRLVSRKSLAHFLLVGQGTDGTNITAQIKALDLVGRVHVLGERSDIPELIPALDIATSSSASEGFSNSIGEAMACGVPCVATDVGDSSFIIGDTGRVVPCKDSPVLADAWQELLDVDPNKLLDLGRAARNRVLEMFSLDRVVMQYERLYAEVVGG